MLCTLNPVDGRKSFYNKAKMFEENNVYTCISYDTVVAKFNKSANHLQIFGWYSVTTARHINSFLAYHGFKQLSKKEIQNYIMPSTD